MKWIFVLLSVVLFSCESGHTPSDDSLKTDTADSVAPDSAVVDTVVIVQDVDTTKA